jgi:hypothetical protein
MKRGTRIEYTYALGKVVQGRIVRPYSGEMPEWYLCKLTDKAGDYSVGCHIGQIRVVDNRGRKP